MGKAVSGARSPASTIPSARALLRSPSTAICLSPKSQDSFKAQSFLCLPAVPKTESTVLGVVTCRRGGESGNNCFSRSPYYLRYDIDDFEPVTVSDMTLCPHVCDGQRKAHLYE